VAAAAPTPKQPAAGQVVIRQVKSGTTDVLQLSPADQVKVVTVAHKAAAAGSTDAAQAAHAVGVSPGPAGATRPGALASAANVRGQLQAAAAELVERQVL
jgi:hypothetical protein